MERTYRGLGFDPAPGELDAVSRTVAQFRASADALDAVPAGLRRAGEISHDWQGRAAEAFRARLADVPAGLSVRSRTLRAAAAILDRWADVLVGNQRHAEDLDLRAVRLRKRIEAARDEVQDRQNALDLAATAAAAAGASADLAAMTTLVAELEKALADVLTKARTLERDHHRAADRVADELAALDAPGETRPAPAGSSLGVLVVAALDRGSRTSSALAGLLTPAGSTGTVAPPATGAFLTALSGTADQ